MADEILLMCPNCNAIWGMEEIDEQYCSACGYPDPNENDIDDEDLYAKPSENGSVSYK
jgi:Zn ribbon nucleic-acid-binding protein